MMDKKLNSGKKHKITRQYKNISNEFNPVSLKARCNLRQINIFLKEKEDKKSRNKKLKMLEKIGNIDEIEEENIKINLFEDNHKLKNKNKSKSFVCPSDKEFKKLKYYQQLERNKIAKEKGFQNYIQKMIPGSNNVQILLNLINKKSSLSYDFYIFPKKENKKEINPYKRNALSAFKKEEIFQKSKNKTMSINNKRNLDIKYKTNGFLKYNKEERYKKKDGKNNRIMSAPKVDWKEKKRKWKEKNPNIAEEDYKFFLDRPISPLTNDKSVKPLAKGGGGVLYSNSIWRTKKINDLVPRLNYNVLGKLRDFKKKRNEIIYKRHTSPSYDLTFLSNKLIIDDNFYP